MPLNKRISQRGNWRQVVALVQKLNQVTGPALNQMAAEVSNGIATASARQWLKYRLRQNKRNCLKEQLNKLVSLVADQEIEISTVQEQVETSVVRLTQVEECDPLTRTAQLPQTPNIPGFG